MSTPKEIVQRWHDALNQGDVEQLSALVHPEVEIGGAARHHQGRTGHA